MSYKTILVHLNSEPRARPLLEMGVQLARKFEAHLIGLYVFPSYHLSPPIPLPFGSDIAGQIRGALKKEVEAVKAVFEEVTARQPFSSEWRSITTERRPPEQVVLDHTRAADLVIAGQADPGWQFTDILDFPESLAIGSGRPVLVIPNFGRPLGLPKIITVAWNGRKEAARALSDAMPLLLQAERVNVLTIDDGRTRPEGHLPDTEIAAALARHGVKVQLTEVKATEYTVGEELRVRASEQGADLIVMGCYGHSRFREFALGGVTRHMLREMTLPIMLSH